MVSRLARKAGRAEKWRETAVLHAGFVLPPWPPHGSTMLKFGFGASMRPVSVS